MKMEDLKKKVQALEDLEEIKTLHREYMFWVNNRQWDDVINCFTEDASVLLPMHGLFRGKDEITHLYKDLVDKINAGQARDAHFVLQPVITLNGNSAMSHWLMYIIISDPATGKLSRLIRGRHDAEYVRVDGKWKIKSLKYTRPWPEDPDTLKKYLQLEQGKTGQ
jgi:ketosteroid isomerase-like protein